MSINSIHNSMMKLHKNLMDEKFCVIVFPNDCSLSNYRNKQFKVGITTTSPANKYNKKDETVYSTEDIAITIVYDTLKETRDVKNTINILLSGFKKYKSKVRYDGNTYIVDEESKGEYKNSILLICKRDF